MTRSYVDTSVLAAVVFGERDSPGVLRRLRARGQLVSSNLLEAELRAAVQREGLQAGAEVEEILSWVEWILPARPLSEECQTVLEHGQLKGADLWHLACALHLKAQIPELGFYSLDRRQLEVARRLGFEARG